MNGEDIIRMAREVADKDKVDPYLNEFVVLTPEELERFATLVAAAEREACAKFIEHDYVRQFERPWRDDLSPWRDDLSAAIRARSE